MLIGRCQRCGRAVRRHNPLTDRVERARNGFINPWKFDTPPMRWTKRALAERLRVISSNGDRKGDDGWDRVALREAARRLEVR